jgi:hypothetical protein
VDTPGREAASTQCPAPGSRLATPANRPSGGIGGIERMRLVRDDIAARVADLLDRMQT